MNKNPQNNRSVKALLFLTLAYGLLTFSACKKGKDDDTSIDAFTVTIDGTAKTFNKNTSALVFYYGSGKLTTIQGAAADGSIISITLAGDITAGRTYSNTAANDDDKPLISYNIDGANYLNDDSSIGNQASVTVTSINATAIKGAFNGDLIEFPTGDKKKVITNGKFEVKLSKQTAK